MINPPQPDLFPDRQNLSPTQIPHPCPFHRHYPTVAFHVPYSPQRPPPQKVRRPQR